MNKKIILAIVSIAVAIALLVGGVVLIINGLKPTVLSVVDQEALAGDTIRIPIEIDNNHGLWMGSIYIEYDPNVLEFISCAKGDVFEECEANVVQSGELALLVNESISKLSNTKKNGEIAVLNFKIKDHAASGEYKILFDDDTAFYDITVKDDEELIYPQLENGTVYIK